LKSCADFFEHKSQIGGGCDRDLARPGFGGIGRHQLKHQSGYYGENCDVRMSLCFHVTSQNLLLESPRPEQLTAALGHRYAIIQAE
jgi:hypothetical protein